VAVEGTRFPKKNPGCHPLHESERPSVHRVDGVTWLLEQGSDPEARDDGDLLPGDYWSVSSPHYATLRTLLDAARHGCGLK
jgi:hypothetical protein